MQSLVLGALLAAVPLVAGQHYNSTYLPATAPAKTQPGQAGTNACGTAAHADAQCQNLYINSVDDFCVYGPPSRASIGVDERIVVSYCVRDGYGTRLIPDGTIHGAHFVQTKEYVQITGVGDFTKINVSPGDGGGELDPHGADGNGNPIGALVFGSSMGGLQQYHEWTHFIGANSFCLRACKDGPRAKQLCGHIWDEMGCFWNMPGSYDAGVFENCRGDSTEPMGIYSSVGVDGLKTTSTFHQGDPTTPPAHAAGPTSNCARVASVHNQLAVSPTSTFTPTATPTTTTSSSSSTTTSTTTTTSATIPVTPAGGSTPLAPGASSPTGAGQPAPSGTAPASAASALRVLDSGVFIAAAMAVVGALLF